MSSQQYMRMNNPPSAVSNQSSPHTAGSAAANNRSAASSSSPSAAAAAGGGGGGPDGDAGAHAAEIAQCQADIQQLRAQIASVRKGIEGNGKHLSSAAAASGASSRHVSLSVRRVLRGHFQKVVALCTVPVGSPLANAASSSASSSSSFIGSNPYLLISAAQDGKLILWNTLRGTKHRIVSLRSCWVLTCQLAPTTQRWLASGGLDNVVSLYALPLPAASATSAAKAANPQEYTEPPNATLTGHEGYISSVQIFNNDATCLSTSGDKSILLWDISSQHIQQHLHGHQGDVLTSSLDGSGATPLIVSGGTDRSARVWDVRTRGGLVHSFTHEHNGDVNCIRWLPTSGGGGSGVSSNGTTFATACDDGRVRLFDIRANAMLETFQTPNGSDGVNSGRASTAGGGGGAANNVPTITCIDFSATGSLLFSASEDGSVGVWDTKTGTLVHSVIQHDAPVSAVKVSANGKAVISASWDCTCKVWTQ